jgi:hypothetical protein
MLKAVKISWIRERDSSSTLGSEIGMPSTSFPPGLDDGPEIPNPDEFRPDELRIVTF